MKPKITGICIAASLAFSAAAQAEGISGSMLGNTCAGCHGVNGASAGATIPSLAGMPKAFIKLAMKQYKSGARSSTIMGRVAKGYSEEQVDAMADFFARQPWASAPQKANAAMVSKGKKLHATNCENECHMRNGTSSDKEMPRLAGQWEGYLQLYLGIREPGWENKHPKLPRFVRTTASADDIAALAQFYASQK